MPTRISFAWTALVGALGCLSAIPAAFAAPTASSVQFPGATRVYHGAWFDIRYPAGFRVTPGTASVSSTTGRDSATFTSPDGAVEFYVFSPQWDGGECPFARMDARTETAVSSSAGQMPHYAPGHRLIDTNTVRWVTVRAKDGSYTRSWQDSRNADLHCRYVIGIRYASATAFARYKAQYAAFKKSLVQFAD